MSPIGGREMLDIKNLISNNFTKSDWLEFGYYLESYDIINDHPRLLRSLSFGDDDYDGNILEVLTQVIKRDPNRVNQIKSYLSEKFSVPIVSEFVSTAHIETPKKLISFSPQVFQIPDASQNKKLISVMLPFKLGSTYDAVKKACEDLNLECKKADDIWVNTTFIQDIFELIFTSQVVVADFTDKNSNVFYEVGIAHTLGKTVIPISQSISDVPSDLGHHRVLKYLPNKEGYEELTAELMKRLRTLVPEAFEI
jgi:hypothetical protein